VLGAMLERVRDVLSVDTAAVLLVTPEGDEVMARAARGLEEEVERGIRIPIGKGFAGRIAAERRPVVLDDVDHADVLNPVRAAAAMGQIRTGLRAYALDHLEPGPVLDRLDRLVRGFEGKEMATVAYLVLDPSAPSVTYSLAGHPPPLVISSSGATRFLDAVRSRPIGVAAARPYETAEAELEPGDTLLLYTDGAIEKRSRPIEEGIAELERVAAERPRHPEELLAEVEALANPPDDVALLALRLPSDRSEPLRLRLDAEANSLAPMRRALRDWLGAVGANEDEAYDILVAVGEAAANAIEHAYGPAPAHFEIDADLDGETVAITVRDEGIWRAPRGLAPRARPRSHPGADG
jgi:anti-sigma regulatory factor (Ser/Thr protein kinase)